MLCKCVLTAEGDRGNHLHSAPQHTPSEGSLEGPAAVCTRALRPSFHQLLEEWPPVEVVPSVTAGFRDASGRSQGSPVLGMVRQPVLRLLRLSLHGDTSCCSSFRCLFWNQRTKVTNYSTRLLPPWVHAGQHRCADRPRSTLPNTALCELQASLGKTSGKAQRCPEGSVTLGPRREGHTEAGLSGCKGQEAQGQFPDPATESISRRAEV